MEFIFLELDYLKLLKPFLRMRKCIYDLPIRQRGNGLNCLEKIKAQELMEGAASLILANIDEEDDVIDLIIDLLLFEYIVIMEEREKIAYQKNEKRGGKRKEKNLSIKDFSPNFLKKIISFLSF